jgi:hypothetical protein
MLATAIGRCGEKILAKTVSDVIEEKLAPISGPATRSR